LTEEFGAITRLIPSTGGVFEVVADGELIFSKKNLNRFPEDGEIVSLLRSLS
jgi:selenoprotein W-related protein